MYIDMIIHFMWIMSQIWYVFFYPRIGHVEIH